MNFFIADTHFGHERCLEFDNRPFSNIEDHDNAMIELWNESVGIDDDVYILGDVSWHNPNNTVKILQQLNGNKHLIIGNHDGKLLKTKKVRDEFVEICHYKEITLDDGTGVVLSHYPIPCFRNHYYGWIMLYGHVHNSWEQDVMCGTVRRLEYDSISDKFPNGRPCRMYNVGAMMDYINYIPRTLTEILSACEG